MNPNNARDLCLTAAAGTELAVPSSPHTINSAHYSYALPCSAVTGVYNPKTFILHAASLHQTFVHCEKFSTAATRRCLDRVSVPVWPANLSVRLPIKALVSHYLANKLIGRGSLFWRLAALKTTPCGIVMLCGISPIFTGLFPT